MENQEVTGGSQRGFTEGKVCPPGLVGRHSVVMVLVDKGRAMDTIPLALCRACDTVTGGHGDEQRAGARLL